MTRMLLVTAVASAVLAYLVAGAGPDAAAQSAAVAAKTRKPPTRLWYRVTIRYSGTERISGRAESTKMTYSQVYRRGVELHPQTAVLLRAPVPGASPLAFSVLRGRPLLGRVTRWSWDVEEEFPGCTRFERHESARKLGQAQARLAAEQAPSGVGDDVYVGVVDRDGRASGPHGLVAEHIVILPWTCNAQALQRAGVGPLGGPGERWKPIEFQEECPEHPDEGCFGRRTPLSIDLEPSFLNMRIPSCQNFVKCFDAHRIRGARFGTQRFERTARVHQRRPYASPDGDNGIRTIDETWTYTFTRCPKPQPC